ncbi:hypothetical protein [Deinococcus aquaticus]|uniref:hypothetical protein n=1 Tax=Deinococcus aquaticus TaxID=328692 RepID=UPI00361196EA
MTRFPALPALLGSALLAGALASCAPALTGPQTGRIVNTRTGQEGTVTFVRGSLNARLPDVFAPDNATIVIGERTYTGRTYLLDGVASPCRPAAVLAWALGPAPGEATPETSVSAPASTPAAPASPRPAPGT